MSIKNAILSAADTYSDAILVLPGKLFNLSIYDDFVGTISVQRSFDNEVTWLNVEEFTTKIERKGRDSEYLPVHYRAGFEAGNFTSGQAKIRLSTYSDRF